MIALFLISTTLILMGGFGSMHRQPFSLVEEYDVNGNMVGTLPNLLKARYISSYSHIGSIYIHLSIT